jgi:hypothetical protein
MNGLRIEIQTEFSLEALAGERKKKKNVTKESVDW